MLASDAPAGGGGFAPSLLLIVLLFVVMYFLMIRPQQKRRREALQMQNSLGVGDRIVTIGGLHGTIIAVADDVATIEIAPGVQVQFARPAIARKVPDPTAEAVDTPSPVVDDTVAATPVEEPIVNPVTDARNKD